MCVCNVDSVPFLQFAFKSKCLAAEINSDHGTRSGLCAEHQTLQYICTLLLLLYDPFVCSHVSVEFNQGKASAAPWRTTRVRSCRARDSPLKGKHRVITSGNAGKKPDLGR